MWTVTVLRSYDDCRQVIHHIHCQQPSGMLMEALMNGKIENHEDNWSQKSFLTLLVLQWLFSIYVHDLDDHGWIFTSLICGLELILSVVIHSSIK